MSAEPTVASRLVFRGQIATLRVDEVRLPGGRVSRREIVEHPGAAAVVPITEAGEVVMVRQYRKAVERWQIEIPAGTLEPGETAAACARRELAEEVGLEAADLRPLLVFAPSPGILTEEIALYVARGLTPVDRAPPPDEEGLERLRVPLREIPAMIRRGEIQDGKSLVALLYLLWSGEADGPGATP